MAFNARAIWELHSGGSNNNGGAFNPANANFATDLTATSANTASPVVSSASYNFAAGDVGGWLFVQSGTNWIPGWYKISSVASNQATLDASVGAAILYAGGVPIGVNSTAGCATTASPTGGVWGVDYSQADAARITFTDAVIGGTTTQFTSAGNPVGKNFVGNHIRFTSGTGWTVQTVEVVSTSGTTATCDKSLGTGASTGGNGNLGGALATWAQAESLRIASNGLFIKAGTYNISTGITTAATSNSLPNVCPDWTLGYTTTRLDGGIATITATANITMLTISANNSAFGGIVLDGADTAATCWSLSGLSNAERGMQFYNCGATRFATRGWIGTGSTFGGPIWVRCRVWDAKAGATSGIQFYGGYIYACEFNCVECDGISHEGTNSAGGVIFNNIFWGNTVAGKYFIKADACLGNFFVVGNTFHTSQTDHIYSAGSYQAIAAMNNVIISGGGYGMRGSVVKPPLGTINFNAFYGNTSGKYNGFSNGLNDVILTGDPCTNGTSGDLSLDNTANEGAACRAAGYPGAFPGGTTTGYRDIGAAQHQDSGGGATVGVIF